MLHRCDARYEIAFNGIVYFDHVTKIEKNTQNSVFVRGTNLCSCTNIISSLNSSEIFKMAAVQISDKLRTRAR